MIRPLRTLLFTFALPVCASAVHAQTLKNGSNRECIEAASQSDLRRVAGFLRSDAADSAPEILKPADILLETLGEAVRAYLNAKPGDLPIGEPAFTRFNTWGELVVTLFRDGRLSTAVTTPSEVLEPSQIAGTKLLESLLRKSWDAGDRVFWPEKAHGDSATFRISFWGQIPRRDGSVPDDRTRFAVAVFSIALPWEEPASADDDMKPRYPIRNLDKGIEGTITLSFVVDTTGYALISSAHDVFPPHAARPVGEMADFYRDFVRAAAEVLPRARFHPANIAGCKVQQRVNLPFAFKLSDAIH